MRWMSKSGFGATYEVMPDGSNRRRSFGTEKAHRSQRKTLDGPMRQAKLTRCERKYAKTASFPVQMRTEGDSPRVAGHLTPWRKRRINFRQIWFSSGLRAVV